jgi:hypothetical protein
VTRSGVRGSGAEELGAILDASTVQNSDRLFKKTLKTFFETPIIPNK